MKQEEKEKPEMTGFEIIEPQDVLDPITPMTEEEWTELFFFGLPPGWRDEKHLYRLIDVNTPKWETEE